MTRVVLRSGAGELSIDAPDGARLADLCDDAVLRGESAALLPRFSCRDANCGTCVVSVEEGAEHLDPPSDAERACLARIGAAGRLACRAVVRGGLPGAPQRLVLRIA